VGGAQATLAGRQEVDPTDQPRPSHARVEGRVLQVLGHRLRAPLPSCVSHVIGLLLGLAPQRPGGTFTVEAMGMQVDAHGLLSHLDVCLLA
jgi:hypothetical protein